MVWNWQLPQWPQFFYSFQEIAPLERQFLLDIGTQSAYLKNIDPADSQRFIVDLLSTEGLESSLIEGELLNRESLQSSIKRHFGITAQKKGKNKEDGLAELLCNVYETYHRPLTHQMLWEWHQQLFKTMNYTLEYGKYRDHAEPMQIVSNRYDSLKIFFEAPPSKRVYDDMTNFIEWFNASETTESILGRAAIAHVYFESIHPFEDGNGRIGRCIIEKALSQGVQRPALITVSKVLEKRKKEYYGALERCNRTLKIDHWVQFFAEIVLQAQAESMELLNFLIVKSKILTALAGQLNSRQEKVLLRMFEEGPAGFKGGLSAENYIAITKASRATSTRDLAELVDMGALIKTGTLRHTRYYLHD